MVVVFTPHPSNLLHKRILDNNCGVHAALVKFSITSAKNLISILAFIFLNHLALKYSNS